MFCNISLFLLWKEKISKYVQAIFQNLRVGIILGNTMVLNSRNLHLEPICTHDLSHNPLSPHLITSFSYKTQKVKTSSLKEISKRTNIKENDQLTTSKYSPYKYKTNKLLLLVVTGCLEWVKLQSLKAQSSQELLSLLIPTASLKGSPNHPRFDNSFRRLIKLTESYHIDGCTTL